MIRPSAYPVLKAISQWEDSCSSLTKGFPPISRALLGGLALRSSHTGPAVFRVTLDPQATIPHMHEEKAAQQHTEVYPLPAQLPLQAQGSSLLSPAHPGVQSRLPAWHGDAHLSHPGWQQNCITQQLSHSAAGGTQRSGLCQCTETHKTFINTSCLKIC